MSLARALRNVATIGVILAATASIASSAPSRSPGASRAIPPRTHVYDTVRRADANAIECFFTNYGTIGWDLTTGNAGLYYPRGSGKTALFASGLWLGAQVGGATRVAVAEYSSEFVPGRIVGGVPDDPSRPGYRVWKVAAWQGSDLDTAHVERSAAELAADPALDPLLHHGWGEYLDQAAPLGAPTRIWHLPNTATPDPTDSVDVLGPDVPGDVMLWCVYNDADPTAHRSIAGATLPLGVEVRQTAFQLARPGALNSTLFVRWQIRNAGPNTLDNLYAAYWADADIGGATDDLAGCSSPHSYGFTYNAGSLDALYGGNPPALGFDWLQDRTSPLDGRLAGMDAFEGFINGTDPNTFTKTYNALQGLAPDGTPVVDPTTGLVTRLWFPGNPVSGSGWLDLTPADHRALTSRYLGRLAPGESVDLWGALVVAQGETALGSVALLDCYDQTVQSIFDGGFAQPFPPSDSASCPQVTNCPRSSEWWAGECASGPDISASDLTRIAQYADSLSAVFDWGATPRQGWCNALAQVATARDLAEREYAAFLANVAAMALQIKANGTYPIGFDLSTPLSCPVLAPTDLRRLYQPVPEDTGLMAVDWDDLNPAHSQALVGVDVGLRFFGGGADYGANLFGSSVPADGGPNVEIRFTGGPAGQKAYRYLRTLDAGGNRVYLFQDYVDVPFTVWDVDHNIQLNAAFLEDAGPPPAPSLDGQWDPDASANGGREILWAMASAYSGLVPDPYYTDPANADLLQGTLDLRYALWSRAVAADAVIDAGDLIRFRSGLRPTTSAETMLLRLAGLPPGPEVTAQYSQLADCLAAVNQGAIFANPCGAPTPVLVSLVDASAQPDEARVVWYAPFARGGSVTAERSDGTSGWQPIATLAVDGGGLATLVDRNVRPDARYGYRVSYSSGGQMERAGEVWLDVPGAPRTMLAGVQPNPTSGDRMIVRFALTGRAAASLEIFDVGGRRVARREVGHLGPGTHTVDLAAGQRLAAGIYVVRLKAAGLDLSRKAVVIAR